MRIPPLELVVLEGGGKNTCHAVRSERVTLGRLDPGEAAPPDAVLFSEPTVSKLHALLEWDSAKRRFLLTHRSATNPTVINGAKVTRPQHVHPGDRVQMGKLLFELRIGRGQHADPEIGLVDVPGLIRSVRATPVEAVQWVAHTPVRPATPIPTFAECPAEVVPLAAIALPTMELEVAVEAEPLAAEPEAAPVVAPVVKATPYRRNSRKIGRNEPCPCGSGRKFKKCCGR